MCFVILRGSCDIDLVKYLHFLTWLTRTTFSVCSRTAEPLVFILKPPTSVTASGRISFVHTRTWITPIFYIIGMKRISLSLFCPQKSEGILFYSLGKIHVVCKIAPSCGWLKTPPFTSWREITCGSVYVCRFSVLTLIASAESDAN